MEKVKDFTKNGVVIVDGHYALISIPQDDGYYNEKLDCFEPIKKALSVDLDDDVVEKNGRKWFRTYWQAWFKGDKNPSVTWEDDCMVEASSSIFLRR